MQERISFQRPPVPKTLWKGGPHIGKSQCSMNSSAGKFAFLGPLPPKSLLVLTQSKQTYHLSLVLLIQPTSLFCNTLVDKSWLFYLICFFLLYAPSRNVTSTVTKFLTLELNRHLIKDYKSLYMCAFS